MVQENEKIEIKPIPIGDSKIRSKIRFEVVTARVIETGGKKHVVCESLIKLRGCQNLFFQRFLYPMIICFLIIIMKSRRIQS